MSGFRVDADDLDAHARFVEQAAVGPLVRAAGAGRPLDGLAYGIIGQVFALAAAGAASTASEAVSRFAGRAAELRDGVRATADAYRRAEQAGSAMFGGDPR